MEFMQKQFDLIVWDWDGTLVDSTGMIAAALIKATEEVGLPLITAEQVKSIIGLGMRESIQVLYGDIPENKAQALARHYSINYYASESHISLFEGASETIVELSKRGFKLAVATGKGRRGLDSALVHSQLTHYFHATRTVDECLSKPHPQMLNELMDDLGVLPERTLMIGDTSYDLQMANAAGVGSVGVTYGAQVLDEWQYLRPVMHFDKFSDLSLWLLDAPGV